MFYNFRIERGRFWLPLSQIGSYTPLTPPLLQVYLPAVLKFQANEKINYTENLKSSQRQPLVVVSIPGLSIWAQTIEDQKNCLKHLEQQPNTTKRLSENGVKLKRSFNEFAQEAAGIMSYIQNIVYCQCFIIPTTYFQLICLVHWPPT